MIGPMKHFLILILLSGAVYADVYRNFEELRAKEKEGIDYRIDVVDQGSPVSLLAPHGGLIERGSSELIQEISGSFNQYHFMGMKEKNNFDLHITSANFDEPQALKLVGKSKRCVSFHGYIGKGENAICIGGLDTKLAKKIKSHLETLEPEFEILYPCAKYPGTHAGNIVNRCEENGVQLEMSSAFRDRILEDNAFRKDLAKVIQAALAD